MRSKDQLEMMYFDSRKNQILLLKGNDLTSQIDKLKKTVEHMLGKMQKFGDYELSEFTASLGVELGALVFKANGSIQMKWMKKSPKKG
jgi:hypothetical protein